MAALLPRLNLAVAALLFLLVMWAWHRDLTWLVWAGGLGGALFLLSGFNVFIEKRRAFISLFGLLGAALLANARGWDWLAWVLGVMAAAGLWMLVAVYIEETFTAGAAEILITLVFSIVGTENTRSSTWQPVLTPITSPPATYPWRAFSNQGGADGWWRESRAFVKRR